MLLKCLWNLILICDDIFSFNLSYVITSNHAFICHEEFNKIPKLIFSFDAFFWNFIHISSYFSFLIWRTYFSVFIFLYAAFFFAVGSTQYLFLHLLLTQMSFSNSLLMKDALLPLTNFFFKGACLLTMPRNLSVKRL